jgi:Domain of unknown function (DUF5063)
VADDFERLARAYCDFVERDPATGRAAFVTELERHLVALYRAALDLELGDPPEVEAPRLSHEEWRATYDHVASLLGDADGYWLVFNPFAQETPVHGQLADDVADIYRDLKSGLALIDGHPSVDASWDWRFTFDSHWGRHAASAIYALRVLVDSGGAKSG